MNLDTIEKILQITMYIKELISLYKQRDTFLNSISIFMDSITQSTTSFKQATLEGKLKKDPSLPKAFDLLSQTLNDFQKFLEKENKSNKLFKFLKGSSLRISSQKYMDEIQKQVLVLNLAVTIRYGNEQMNRFDDVVKMMENMDEKLKQIGIMQKFQNQIAADFWIQNFGEEQTVDSKRFMERFKFWIMNQEKIVLDEKQSINIMSLLDEDQQKTVNFKQWDVFFNDIWSFFERKQEIICKKELIMQINKSFKLSELLLIYEETHPECPKEFDYPLKHIFKITDEYYEFIDVAHNRLKNPKNLIQEGLIIGKKKSGINPDIYFDPHLKTISGKQFQITAKNYLNAHGYYINDLSTTNTTSFKVENRPYALNNQMLFDLNGHIFEVLKVIPEPSDENNKGYYFVPTAGMENFGESLIEETIKLVKRKNERNKKVEEGKKEDEDDDENGQTEKTFKRKPKVYNAANKLTQPSIIIKCIEGINKDKKFELFAKSNKEAYVAGVGSAKDNAIVIDDPEGILDYNSQIVFVPEFNCWIIAEKWQGSKQSEYSVGTLIYLKTAEDYKKDQTASFACKLRNGMKIFFNCHVLTVHCQDE